MNKKALLPLIGLFLLVTGIVLPGSAYAQISEGGTPTSFKYTEKRSANRSDPHQFQRRGPENSRQMAGQPRGTAESRSFTPDRPDNRQCW